MKHATLTVAAAAALALVAAPLAAQGPPAHAQGARPEQARHPDNAQDQGQTRAKGQGQGQGQSQAKAQAQGQGQGQAKGQGQGQGQQGQGQGKAKARGPQGQGQPGARGQGQARAAEAPGRGRGAARGVARRGGPAPDPAVFNRNVMEGAIRARSRRHGGAAGVSVQRGADGVRVVDDGGRLLFSLSSGTASELGYWRAAVVPRFREDGYGDRPELGGIFRDDRARYPEREDDDRGPPAFCRSGAGHPVWGRAWCLDKGFGLGDDRAVWGVDRDIGGVIIPRPDTRRVDLDRGGLRDVLGDIVFGRLAVQSLVLGADQPLAGRWMGQTEGPRTLRVTAGDLPIAELVDYDRDDRVDTILFNLGN